jgi:putative NADH-flavin reductase
MRLFILGATGKTGTALVEQALARGHEVTAFVRSAFNGDNSSLRILRGDPMNATALGAEIPRHDAVLSSLGTRGFGATSVLTEGASSAIEAMRVTGLKRLLIVSSTLQDPNIGWFPGLFRRTLLRHIVKDQHAMEELVTKSGLDWTVFRAARLTNGALTGKYTSSESEISGAPPMSRKDLACMMLDAAERSEHIRQKVRVCGGGS